MPDALEVLQAIQQAELLKQLPTAADVVAQRVVITSTEVVLILRKNGQWQAFGPYPTADVEWARLPADTRVYVG
jgi:hypothetical protein